MVVDAAAHIALLLLLHLSTNRAAYKFGFQLQKQPSQQQR
jgi:hypothetical protein